MGSLGEWDYHAISGDITWGCFNGYAFLFKNSFISALGSLCCHSQEGRCISKLIMWCWCLIHVYISIVKGDWRCAVMRRGGGGVEWKEGRGGILWIIHDLFMPEGTFWRKDGGQMEERENKKQNSSHIFGCMNTDIKPTHIAFIH